MIRRPVVWCFFCFRVSLTGSGEGILTCIRKSEARQKVPPHRPFSTSWNFLKNAHRQEQPGYNSVLSGFYIF